MSDGKKFEALAQQAGVKVTEREPRDSDVVVCCPVGTKSPFTDNVEATCMACGTPVFHRPHVPAACLKICIACGMAEMREEMARGENI